MSKEKFRSLVVIAISMAAIIILAGSAHLFLTPGMTSACLPYYQKRFSDPSGLVFDFSETDCDSLAKEAYTEVFVSADGGRTKTLIFKYDPEDRIYPSAKVTANREIEISIKAVSSIFYRAHSWEGRKIRFDVGKIQYSAKTSSVENGK